MSEQGRRVPPAGLEDDDVEGHVQPPRGDDTDHVHGIVLQERRPARRRGGPAT
jgi:hypothetical protein